MKRLIKKRGKRYDSVRVFKTCDCTDYCRCVCGSSHMTSTTKKRTATEKGYTTNIGLK